MPLARGARLVPQISVRIRYPGAKIRRTWVIGMSPDQVMRSMAKSAVPLVVSSLAASVLSAFIAKEGDVAVAVRGVVDQPLVGADGFKLSFACRRRGGEVDIALFKGIGPVVGEMQRFQKQDVLAERHLERPMQDRR